MLKSYDEIKEQIENMDDCEIVDIWNQYCDECRYPDDRIYEMYMFEELVNLPSDWDEFWNMARELEDFDRCDSYFCYDGCGRLCSLWNPWDKADAGDLARAIEDEQFTPNGYDFEEEDEEDESNDCA